ncbi:hypothetical protein GOODEAATRI_004225 [Goodea atripinnis]|uniref:Uncharacterized protein n=1 Tax=Goodea atripinnis TaxID=208336 RepID=A0ABV0P1J3_9TELE
MDPLCPTRLFPCLFRGFPTHWAAGSFPHHDESLHQSFCFSDTSAHCHTNAALIGTISGLLTDFRVKMSSDGIGLQQHFGPRSGTVALLLVLPLNSSDAHLVTHSGPPPHRFNPPTPPSLPSMQQPAADLYSPSLSTLVCVTYSKCKLG